ncbi:MAG: hypothetical protein AAGD88_11570, partial [Bacteroidota bacterium]
MIVWSGRGFLIVVVLFVVLFSSLSVLPESYADYCFAIAAFLTAMFSWFFGIKWNRNLQRTVIDEKSGKRLVLKSNHTL